MANTKKSAKKIRLEIAHVAARYIAMDGINDFFLAKRKAADQLGINNDGYLPSNQEIEAALIDYQRIYQTDTHADNLKKLRSIAQSAMEFLHEFSPFLVGPVLSGTATNNSGITLHLFTDEPELVAIYLDNNGIPFTYTEKKIIPKQNTSKQQPAIEFNADGHDVLLVIFSLKEKGMTPLSSIDGKPMSRASLSKLRELLQQADIPIQMTHG